MIDLTPLDVRKKAGDFRKILRGYDPAEVESFLQLAADRLEELVKENLTLKERSERLLQQVLSHEGRENAVQEALVMAQKLREDMRAQTEREAQLSRDEAEAEIQRTTAEAERRLANGRRALAEIEQRRVRFLKSFRALLQRELEAIEVEEGRLPEQEPTMELDLGSRKRKGDAQPSQGKADGFDSLWLSSILQEGSGDQKEEESSS